MIPLVKPEEFYKLNYLQNSKYQNSKTDSENRFELHRIEEHIKHIKFPLKPHRKTVYDFLLITSGSVTRTKNLTQETISKNQVFFVPEYQVTSTTYVSNQAKGYYCHFDKTLIPLPFLHSLQHYELTAKPSILLNNEKAAFIVSLLERLLSQREEKISIKLKASYIKTILIEFEEAVYVNKSQELSKKHLIGDSFIKLLNDNLYALNKVSEYADLLHISPNHLNKTIKRLFNKTAKEMILEMKLLESQVLLKQSTYSVSEISHKLFDKEPSDFSRLFKKRYSITPSQFRIDD